MCRLSVIAKTWQLSTTEYLQQFKVTSSVRDETCEN